MFLSAKADFFSLKVLYLGKQILERQQCLAAAPAYKLLSLSSLKFVITALADGR